MTLEIERKFLVTSDNFIKLSQSQRNITQGFLNTHKERVVRIRLIDEKGFLTIKGVSSDDGSSRFEWEKEISKNDAKHLLKLCEPGVIEKTRYFHQYKGHLFEIDIFYGDNSGLIIAEVELNKIDKNIELPNYIGKEVTGDSKYYNSQLSKQPFKKWI